MKKYNWFQKIGKSFVPGDFYLDILYEKMRYAILYILLFILLLSVAVGVYTGAGIKSGIDAVTTDYNSGIIPPVSITGGTLDIDGDGPILIDYFDALVVIDDDYKLNVNDVMDESDYFLLQKDQISITSKGVGPVVYAYNDLFMMDLTTNDLSTILNLVSVMIIPMSILSQFMLSTASFIFNSLFLLILGNILRSGIGMKLRLGQVYHMVIYAMTFSVFWTHFTTLLPAPVPIWLDNFVYFAIPALILINVFMRLRRDHMDNGRPL